MDTLTASQSLRRLRDAGLLAQKGRGSATYYVPTERLVDSGLSTKPEALSSNPESLSSESEGLSSNPPALSSNPEPRPITPSGKFDEALRSQLLDGISGTLAAKVGAVGQRHPPQEVRDVIVALCQVRT